MDLIPIIPFEPENINILPQGDRWIFQVKWDGVRLLSYYDGQKVRLFNRKKNERTLQFPEFLDMKNYCFASSVILDGEIIALEKGKPSFSKVMQRDSLRLINKIEKMRINIPVTYMVFDAIYWNGKWINNESFQYRQEILGKIIKPRPNLQLVESFSDGEALWRGVVDQDLEGIVCKDLNSPYLLGGKDHRWQKLKNYKTLNAVVGGVTFRDGRVNSLLLGLYDGQGHLQYIGHAGTGRITLEQWKTFTAEVRDLIIDQCPFVETPQRSQEAFWVQPFFTVRIQYIQWTPEGVLRQPSIQSFIDYPVEKCWLPDARKEDQKYGFSDSLH
ncbi:MAG TPA: DNA ligase [Clostridia bacterium]|nr:DNA ligase [Clostridia bacterium]